MDEIRSRSVSELHEQLYQGSWMEHLGRYRELAEAGVQTAIVGLSDADGPASVRRFADVIAAFG